MPVLKGKVEPAYLAAAVLTVIVLEVLFILGPANPILKVCGYLCLPGLLLGFLAGAFTTTREMSLDIVLIVVSISVNAVIYYALFRLSGKLWKERANIWGS